MFYIARAESGPRITKLPIVGEALSFAVLSLGGRALNSMTHDETVSELVGRRVHRATK
jgi:hypothetical protein